MVYTCSFKFLKKTRRVISTDLKTFQGGFWINREYKLSTGSREDAVWFIPPGRIQYIRRSVD